jgi:steroid delta-isomerase-like uncharacterized protein
MSVHDLQGPAAQFYDSFDRGDIDACVAALAEDLVVIDPGMGTVHGREPFRQYLEGLKRAVPDAKAVIEHAYEVGDAVIVEARFVGTHTGPLDGPDGEIAATGAAIDMRFADVSRVIGDKIVSYHTYYDQLDFLTQLGVL